MATESALERIAELKSALATLTAQAVRELHGIRTVLQRKTREIDQMLAPMRKPPTV